MGWRLRAHHRSRQRIGAIAMRVDKSVRHTGKVPQHALNLGRVEATPGNLDHPAGTAEQYEFTTVIEFAAIGRAKTPSSHHGRAFNPETFSGPETQTHARKRQAYAAAFAR